MYHIKRNISEKFWANQRLIDANAIKWNYHEWTIEIQINNHLVNYLWFIDISEFDISLEADSIMTFSTVVYEQALLHSLVIYHTLVKRPPSWIDRLLKNELVK